jgi:hypothetical protein
VNHDKYAIDLDKKTDLADTPIMHRKQIRLIKPREKSVRVTRKILEDALFDMGFGAITMQNIFNRLGL